VSTANDGLLRPPGLKGLFPASHVKLLFELELELERMNYDIGCVQEDLGALASSLFSTFPLLLKPPKPIKSRLVMVNDKLLIIIFKQAYL